MENKPFTPYVYRVTNKITGQFYIGMKATSSYWTGTEIGVDYFTSSTDTVFREDFKKNPQNYICEKLFEGALEDVEKLEGDLIVANKENPLILNKAFQHNGKICSLPGCHRKPEAKKRMSEAAKKRAPFTDEQRKRMSESRKGRKAWNKGVKYTEDQKKNLKTWQPGRAVSDKTRARLSAALKGRKFSDEWRKNLSKGWEKRKEKGLGCTEETRTKMRNSHKKPGSTTKGKHWFTNGIVNTLAYDCPEGYWKGKIKHEKGL